jgi:ABC-2 family transporter protein
MTATTVRLTLRLQAFELLTMTVLTGTALVLTALAITWIDAAGFGPACVAQMRTGAFDATCQAAQEAFYRASSTPADRLAQALVLVVPFLFAAVAGVAVVGRERERGTTRLAWSLSPSRTRWLLGRVVPVGIVVIVLSFAVGVAADRLVAASMPEVDTANGFSMFGFRGIVLAARATFTFAVAVLIGAAVGRTLPALLVTAVVVFIGIAGGSEVHHQILEGEAIVLPGEDYHGENLYFSSGFVLPDGRFAGWQEIEAIDPPPTDGSEWIPRYPQASLAVPGSRYRFVEARESAVLAVGSLAALVLTAFAVRRARPG